MSEAARRAGERAAARTLFIAWPMCSEPFAYGGPSWSTQVGASLRSCCCQRYSCVVILSRTFGSRLAASARIGNDVRGSCSDLDTKSRTTRLLTSIAMARHARCGRPRRRSTDLTPERGL